ncbi:alpha/beta fold hydrolase [Pseudomonas bubulae]|uniref:alpha/beta hydrolase family protein n=1 Tax=Pseudomonas bubulae TaxID=2316085 RepID=UPI0030AE54DA
MLGGFEWRQRIPDSTRAVIIINAATSVRCQYYSRFAEYLFRQGMDVMLFDYRGIGASRSGSLRGFTASWSDWGTLDAEAVLKRAQREYPGQPIDVVGHSFGGCAAGLAASGPAIRHLVTVGAQYAHWRDYAPAQRWQMLAKWHGVMPLLTRMCGYFPGKRLGWLEDTPAGVVKDWGAFSTRYEKLPSARSFTALPFCSVTAKTLAISFTDDPFGTVAAIERLLNYFSASSRTHLRIQPQDIGETAIGHFAFFHSRFQDSLWPIALQWLQRGELNGDVPGQTVSVKAPSPSGESQGEGL